MFAIQLLVCSANSFAEADKTAAVPAADKASADKPATEKVATEKIAAVKVTGNRRIETSAIMLAVQVRPGEILDSEKIDADVRAIYKLGHFRDVQAQVDKKDGGVVLEYVVKEKPIIREIKIEGAKEISVEKVKEALTIKPNTIYSLKDMQNSAKKVKKLYADDGYYLAEVEGTTSTRSDTELDVIIKVKEGKKVLIQQIVFDGNHAFPDKKLRKAMETRDEWMFSWLTGGGTYKDEVLKNDMLLLTELYMNNGYANVKIGEPLVDLLPDKSGLKVNIGITEGDKFKVGTLGFKGELLETSDEMMKKLKEKSGDTFSRANLRTDVFTLTDFYADKGYAFANANPQTRMNTENHTIDIVFDMDKGEKVSIDRISVTGNTKSRDKVIRREMRIEEGDVYNATALKKSKQNLMNTGFFEEANLTTLKTSSPDKLDINVDVKEKATGTFSIGAGYSSLDGVVGQGSVQQSNFLGLGLKGSAAVSYGAKTKTYNLGLTDPYFLDSKWTLGGDLYRTERQYLDYTRRATGADIKGGYPITDTLSTFWLYKYEVKSILDESSSLLDGVHNGSVAAPESSSTVSAIIASLSSNTTDFHPDPTIGLMDSLSVEFAGLGGSTHYLRYITEHTAFYPVAWGSVASLRGTLGYIQRIGQDIPIDEKFYLGGIASLRGYSARTVCPIQEGVGALTDGTTGLLSANNGRIYLGGEVEAVANLEYTFPLLKDAGLKGVLFFDAGNSANSLRSAFANVLTSYGAGIRWFSPIGPLRLEYGFPIKPRESIDNPSGRLEFSIGSIF